MHEYVNLDQQVTWEAVNSKMLDTEGYVNFCFYKQLIPGHTLCTSIISGFKLPSNSGGQSTCSDSGRLQCGACLMLRRFEPTSCTSHERASGLGRAKGILSSSSNSWASRWKGVQQSWNQKESMQDRTWLYSWVTREGSYRVLLLILFIHFIWSVCNAKCISISRIQGSLSLRKTFLTSQWCVVP